ncbi:hypothetical protein, partial [Pseudomonas aeruginosa]|uniref:hypothetical protein n=1 Tax=Pseudomonas aeruginosa TaxID=287 RepID=UPI001C4E3E1F
AARTPYTLCIRPWTFRQLRRPLAHIIQELQSLPAPLHQDIDTITPVEPEHQQSLFFRQTEDGIRVQA